MQPTFIVVGGPNGAGKSTFVKGFLREEPLPYVCADEFAKGLNSANPESVALEAGKQFLLDIRHRIKEGQSMIVESTLSGRTFYRIMKECVGREYRVKLVFIYLDSAELCKRRVGTRVRKGGHHVPDADIERRYLRSLKNFWNLYRPLAHGWQIGRASCRERV